jgi:hypothetical protein
VVLRSGAARAAHALSEEADRTSLPPGFPRSRLCLDRRRDRSGAVSLAGLPEGPVRGRPASRPARP